MHNRLFTPLLAYLVLGFAGPASALAADAWESGKQAFEAGNYAASLELFETARDQGLDSPAVHYNIAVSQFSLGRYEAAGDTFSLIARQFPQMRGLAEYNLGLVARRLGDTGAARTRFLRAYELSPDNRTIRVLASRRLREIDPEIRVASRWNGAFGIHAGADDNVGLLDDTGLSAGATTDSPMAELFATIQGPWDGASGFRVNATAYLAKYPDADQFDQFEIRAGILYDWRPDDWRVQLGMHAGSSTLGGDAFQRKFGARARLLRRINDNASIDVSYSYDDIEDADTLFSGIAGSRQQLEAGYRWHKDSHRVRLRVRLEHNDRLDPGVSPARNHFSVDYRYEPETGLGFEAGVDLRDSDYDDLALTRTEDLRTLRGALTYMLPSNWLIMVETRVSENDSSDDTFSYSRTQIMFGGTRLF